MASVGPFTTPETEAFAGGLMFSIGFLMLIRYLLYMYNILIFGTCAKNVEFNFIKKSGNQFISNNKKVYPTVFSVFFNDENDFISKSNYLIMRTRASKNKRIEMINMGGFYVIQKGVVKVSPILHIVLVLSMSYFAFYRFYS